jgi:hypothetical protein
MTDYTPSDILAFSVNQQPLKVGDAFDALMRDRVGQMIDAHHETYSQQAFNAPEEDDVEFDLPEDELEDDLEDLEIDDLDDVDLSDDLDDLDDLDLDEEDTDEDA